MQLALLKLTNGEPKSSSADDRWRNYADRQRRDRFENVVDSAPEASSKHDDLHPAKEQYGE